MNFRDNDTVYSSNHTAINPAVYRTKRIAELTKGNTAECIKYMSGAKDPAELSAEKEGQRIGIKKQELEREIGG